MEQKALKLIMAGLLILSMALTGREAAEYVGAMHAVNALRETGMGADDSGDSAWSSMPDTEETIRGRSASMGHRKRISTFRLLKN